MTNFTPFSPKIPQSVNLATSGQIVENIVSRMVRGIFNDGRGFSVDLSIVQSEVNHFADRFLRNKSLDQLRLIEAIPSLTVTPALMQACGFVLQQAKNETAVVYIKFVSGKRDTLDRMSKQGHSGSRTYAKKLKSFLSDETRPPHFLELPPDYQVRDSTKPTFYHIGRYINHVRNRRRGENVSQFDPTEGARPWASAVFNSHGDHNLIEYWPLVDHSDLIGAEWYRRMVRADAGAMLISELG
jgi:hypothetical protein